MIDPFSIAFIVSWILTIPLVWKVTRKSPSSLTGMISKGFTTFVIGVTWIICILIVWLIYFAVV